MFVLIIFTTFYIINSLCVCFFLHCSTYVKVWVTCDNQFSPSCWSKYLTQIITLGPEPQLGNTIEPNPLDSQLQNCKHGKTVPITYLSCGSRIKGQMPSSPAHHHLRQERKQETLPYPPPTIIPSRAGSASPSGHTKQSTALECIVESTMKF